jgi:hypothetical protein
MSMARTHLHRPSQAVEAFFTMLGSKSALGMYLPNKIQICEKKMFHRSFVILSFSWDSVKHSICIHVLADDLLITLFALIQHLGLFKLNVQ